MISISTAEGEFEASHSNCWSSICSGRFGIEKATSCTIYVEIGRRQAELLPREPCLRSLQLRSEADSDLNADLLWYGDRICIVDDDGEASPLRRFHGNSL